jgi:hypothetical protein
VLPSFVANLNHLRPHAGPAPNGRKNPPPISLRHSSLSSPQKAGKNLVATFAKPRFELTHCKQMLSQISNRNKFAVFENARSGMRANATRRAPNSNRHLETIRNRCKPFNTKDVTFSNRPKLRVSLIPLCRASRQWPPPPWRARMGMRLLLPEILQRFSSGLQGRACCPFHSAGTQ